MRFWIKSCLLVVVFVTGLTSSASVYAIEVIANPSVQLQQISSSNLRRIFTMRNRQWRSQLPIKVFVMSSQHKIHHQFCLTTLEVFPYQLDKIWGKLLFSGLGEPPQIVKSKEEMIKQVRTTPGAIGYVDELQNSEGLLIISVGNNNE